jgi:hypothetical protein
MLSSLPKLADRAFILGMFLPTLLFVLAALLMFQEVSPAKSWIKALAGNDLQSTAYLLLCVWLLSVLALMLNYPLYRFLEGYSFPTWLANRLKARNRILLSKQLEEIKGLHERWRKEREGFPETDLARYQTLRSNLLKWMPSQQNDVLPTRFGNAIKAFEVYPRDVYGADGVAIWLRLGSVMPKPFNESIEQIQTQINFLMNCCFYSALIATIAFARATYWGVHWLLWAVVAMVLVYLFYRWAVTLIPAWGELVTSAFDCYLPALAHQLGFELPEDGNERRAFWTSFSQQVIYRRGPDGTLPFCVEKWNRATPTKCNVNLGEQDSGAERHSEEERNDAASEQHTDD